jgi:uncharacterized membrane protein
VIRDRTIGWILLVCSALGLGAAVMLLVERSQKLGTCELSPFVSCGSVLDSPQAELLGFPNPFLSLGTQPILAAIAIRLIVGAGLPRRVWLALNAGAAVAVLFVHWLVYESLYVLRTLCPYCVLTWVVTITAFWYVTARNVGGRMLRYHSTGLALWLLTLTVLVAQAFWSRWPAAFGAS